MNATGKWLVADTGYSHKAPVIIEYIVLSQTKDNYLFMHTEEGLTYRLSESDTRELIYDTKEEAERMVFEMMLKGLKAYDIYTRGGHK